MAFDVVQEAWLRIARGLPTLRDPAAFRRWAYTIVTRTAADALRLQKPERSAPPETMDGFASESRDDELRSEAVAELRRALLLLDPEERALVSLHHLEGFGLHELAEMYAVPVGTIKSRLHRVRGRLRDLLERTIHE